MRVAFTKKRTVIVESLLKFSSTSAHHLVEFVYWRVSMAKKAYPLRINEDILNAMQLWAEDELRSVNAQIEYVLRDALRKSGRSKKPNIRPQEIDDG